MANMWHVTNWLQITVLRCLPPLHPPPSPVCVCMLWNCTQILHSPSRSQVPVKYQVEFNVIISIVFVAIFAFIICMSGREYLDMRRGIVPKIVFD